jgi:hypothetical protein
LSNKKTPKVGFGPKLKDENKDEDELELTFSETDEDFDVVELF